MQQPIENSSLELSPERSLGRYRLHHELASGGMASVYLASVDSREGFSKLVALKQIHEHLAKDPEFIEMFLDEARIAARIEHPNVCTVFDFGDVADSYFIAMEYLMGETLRALMREQARRPRCEAWPAMAAHLIAQACEGLHCAHELRGADGSLLGLVHRDVSPQNLFVTYGGCLKVVDFGIARAEGKSHHTAPGTIKGKFSYIAPEQLTGSAEVDRRADVWSLGVTLWEMLALRPLFRRENAVETLTAVATGPIPKPSSIRPEVPAALDAIVLRALSRKREERYATAREMGKELAALCRDRDAVGVVEIEEHMERLFSEEKAKKLAMTQWVRESSVIRPRRGLANDARRVDEAVSIEIDRTPAVQRKARRRSPWLAIAFSASLATAGLVALGAALLREGAAPVAPSPPTPALGSTAYASATSSAGLSAPAESPVSEAATPIDALESIATDAPMPEPPSRRGRTRSSASPRLAPAAAPTEALGTPRVESPLPEPPGGESPAPASPDAPTSASSEPTTTHEEVRPAPTDAAAPSLSPAPRPSAPPRATVPSAASARPSSPPEGPRSVPALEASVSLRNLDARGSLPSSAVSHALARHQRGLRSCYADAARRAGRDAAGAVEVRFVIDEMGMARSVSASGGPLPGLAACVAGAFHGLRTTDRPDIGGVNVRFEVRFSPLASRVLP